MALNVIGNIRNKTKMKYKCKYKVFYIKTVICYPKKKGLSRHHTPDCSTVFSYKPVQTFMMVKIKHLTHTLLGTRKLVKVAARVA